MEQKNFITSWQEAHAIIDEAMTKGDRGKISYNDYRAKLGLPMIKNNENHFSTHQR